jgi:hypothetical protein
MIEQLAQYHPALPDIAVVSLLQLAVMILGGLLFTAALLDRSPVLLLSGFGAMTAVLLLVFKDMLLSLVAIVPEFGLRLFQQPAGTEFSIKQV